MELLSRLGKIRLRHLFYLMYTLIVLVMMGTLARRIHSYIEDDRRGAQRARQRFAGLSKQTQHEYWALEGIPRRIDPYERTMSIDWSLSIGRNGSLSSVLIPGHPSYPVGIYQGERLAVDHKNFTSCRMKLDSQSVPLSGYKVANPLAEEIAKLGQNPWDHFYTKIDFVQSTEIPDWRKSLYFFPFDKWAGVTTFVANRRDLAYDWNSTRSFGREINDAYLVGQPTSWVISIRTNNSCTTTVAGKTVWTTNSSCQLEIAIIAERSLFVICISILVAIVCGAGSLFVVLEGILYIFIHPDHKANPELLVSILAILASIRMLVPDFPQASGTLIETIWIVSMIAAAASIAAVMVHRWRIGGQNAGKHHHTEP